ncbi:hypothetical protein KAR91_09210 [Candidatus Pacearchaeota archaeon]|nr:hypothetical protein [Candidatus Pacearchaeota archaeon]
MTEEQCAGCETTVDVIYDEKSELVVCRDCKPKALEILQCIADHVQFPNS